MKIWQRIFIVTMFIVTVFTLAMGLLLIGNQYKYQIDAEINNSKKFHENVMASVNVEVQRQMQEKTKSILSDHEFLEAYKAAYERFEDLGYGLKLSMDGENIMNNYDFSDDIVNKNMIKQERYAGYEIVHKSDYYFLIMESENSIYGRKIKCDTEYDITHIYEAYFAQRDRLKVLTIVFSLLSGIILLVTIRFLLRPVKKLQWGIHSISDGDYGRQLEVKGNNEITELTKDVNQMSEKIADDNRAKEEMIESRQVFIDNMAHEMKTPLTAILGFSDILTIKQNLTEEQIKEYSGYIYKEALRLKTMSGKLMELAQIEEKNVKGECVDIGNILDEVILSEQIVLEKSNIKINKKIVNKNVMVDKDLIKSVFYNILDNGAKSTTQNGEMDVSMSVENNKVVIKIQDYGIGIPKEDVKKVMEPFYMVDKSRTRKSGGAGLGLALCKKIIELSNGEIEISSDIGKGCLVTVTLPVYDLD